MRSGPKAWNQTKRCATSFGLSLLIAVSTIGQTAESAPSSVPPQTPSPASALVIARNLNVYAMASAQSLVVLQLNQGAQLEVIGTEGSFSKIRYRLEGEFIIEGFAPTSGLRLRDGAAQSNELPSTETQYEITPKSEPVLEVESFPEANPRETVDASLLPKPKEKDTSIVVSKPLKRATGRLNLEGQFGIGLQTLSEDLTTKLSGSETYATEPFLSYEMSGLVFDFEGHASFRTVSTLQLGLNMKYDFTVYRGSVANESASFVPNINKSNVQALMHDIQLGPVARYQFRINAQYSLEPELSVLGAYQLFTTNQLKTKDDLAPGLTGQSVLMNWQIMQIIASLAIRLQMPHELSLKPHLSLGLLTKFSESPTTTRSASGALLSEDEMFRTGKPSGAPMHINYGAQLSWNLRKFGLETIEVMGFFNRRDLSRSFSGSGNRASMLMNDTKTSTRFYNFGLGGRYLF